MVIGTALGCGDYDDSSSDHGYERDREPVYREPVYRDREDYERDGYQSREPSLRDVPRGAVVVKETTTESMRYDPKHAGMVYLFDEDKGLVVYETQMRPGDRIAVDPDRDSIKINNVKDARINLASKHHYRLYYLRDDKAYDRRERY
jgi:hypothetical protein